MSSSQRPLPLNFVEKPQENPKVTQINPHKFAQERGFQWSDEIKFSKQDERALLLKRDQLNVTTFTSPEVHRAFWDRIMDSHHSIQSKIAIYDTQVSDCGLGLMAIADIEPLHFLIYPGEWLLDNGKNNFLQDLSYAFVIRDNNDKEYGWIDAKKTRHYGCFAMHGWNDRAELDNYSFSSQAVKDSIATANMTMYTVLRPEGITLGPPLILGLMNSQKIKAGEPLIWDYGPTYLLEEESVTERFFNKKGGAVIDTKDYATKNNIKIRIYNNPYNSFVDVGYDKNKLSFGRDLKTLDATGGMLVITHQDLSEMLAKKSTSRFITFPKPSEYHPQSDNYFLGKMSNKLSLVTQLLAEIKSENKSAQPSTNPNTLFAPIKDPGKYLRNLVVSKNHSATQLEEYLKRIDSNKLKEVINSSGSDTEMTALHRAAERLEEAKAKVLIAYGADRSLPAKGKTAYDIASEKKGSVSFLEMLKHVPSSSLNKVV